VRPHDIEIFKEETGTKPNFSAYISYIHAIGPLVRLELQRTDHTELIEAELTQERFRELGLAQGDKVFVYPRNVRVFLNNAA
jgi:sulfate transport system ATP-binding protein